MKMVTFETLNRRWKRRKDPLKTPPCVYLVPNSTFHILPLEIRLEIYSYLTGHPSPIPPPSHPPSHPLYPLLFVCHLLRTDITDIFYSSPFPAFKFMTPESCLFFLKTTVSHIHHITSLTLYLLSRQTDQLEPIARKLFLANAPLRALTIHLVSLPERFNRERIVTAYMLPRRIQVSAAVHRETVRREQAPHYWGPPMQLNSSRDFVYAETHSGLAIRLADSSRAALGMLKSVRYLAVHGQPKDGLEFELAILKLHLRMLEVAKGEGKEVVLGKKSKGLDEKLWHYDVWIEGEVEGEGKQ